MKIFYFANLWYLFFALLQGIVFFFFSNILKYILDSYNQSHEFWSFLRKKKTYLDFGTALSLPGPPGQLLSRRRLHLPRRRRRQG